MHTIEVRIEKIVYGGDGLGRSDGRTVFVPFTAPGDLVRAEIVERKKGFLRARVVDILEPGPDRRAAPCPYFGPCGGCQLQHLTYEAQLAAKTGFVQEALSRIGRIRWEDDIPITFDPDREFGYRTRATAHVSGHGRGSRFGYYGFRSHDVVDIASCPLLVPELDAAWQAARGALGDGSRLRDVELSAGDTAAASNPPVEGVGSRDLSATVEGIEYLFGPSVFFQVNRYVVGALVDAVAGSEPAAPGASAVDLYSGVGLFTIPLARRFERVVAVEGDGAASGYAAENLRRNSVESVELVSAPVERWLERAATSPTPMALAVVDPPRGGLGVEASSHLAQLRPERITYVSCDPSTLARDLRVLLDAGYALRSVEAFDLFPQTFHVETVARLEAGA